MFHLCFNFVERKSNFSFDSGMWSLDMKFNLSLIYKTWMKEIYINENAGASFAKKHFTKMLYLFLPLRPPLPDVF